MSTRTFTALFTDPSSAERAMERLRAIGVAQAAMEMHRADAGDIAPGNVAGGGLFGLRDLLVPEAGAAPAGTVVVATGVPEAIAAAARGVLDEDAAEVEEDRGPQAAPARDAE